MTLFCLNGSGSDKLSLELNEVIGFPTDTSYDGGYDMICTLTIDAECYHVKCNNVYSATGALYRFCDGLKMCYEQLAGRAEYRLLLEDFLCFSVEMISGGRAVVCGTFKERSDRENSLQFEFESDQSCFLSVIKSIESLKNTYGGMNGIK